MGMKIFLQNLLGIFCPGRKNFGRPAPEIHIFGQLKILTYRKTWKWPKITQNDPNFQECHLGANTRSRHFSKFFVKNNALREDFGPKIFSWNPSLFSAYRWQKGENPDFRPKMSFGRNLSWSKNAPSGGGVAEIFSTRTKHTVNCLQKNFHGADPIFGRWGLAKVAKHEF